MAKPISVTPSKKNQEEEEGEIESKEENKPEVEQMSKEFRVSKLA